MKLAYCESVFASGTSPWHLRVLTDAGLKLSGGVDSDSLCGRVRAPRGWDINVEVPVVIPTNVRVCQLCKNARSSL